MTEFVLLLFGDPDVYNESMFMCVHLIDLILTDQNADKIANPNYM